MQTESEGTGGTIALVSGNRLDRGGAEAYLLSLLRYRESSHLRFIVVAPFSHRFHERLLGEGLEAVRWDPGFPLDPHSSMWLRSVLQSHHVNLVHVQDLRSGLVAPISAKLAGVPVLTTMHMPDHYAHWESHPSARLRRSYYLWLERISLRFLSDRVIFVSERVRSEALRMRLLAPTKASFIANGVEVDRADYSHADREHMRRQLGARKGAVVLCFIGRIDPQKGVDVLLEAAAMLSEEPAGPGFELWIIGDGPQRSELEQDAVLRGLGSRVRFLGWRDDVPAVLPASDIFVLPSRYEGMPIALLEAMNAGLPCVVTEVGDCGRLVREAECGLVAVPESAESLASSLRTLLSNHEMRAQMGRSAASAGSTYDDRKMALQVYQIYRQMIGRAAGNAQSLVA